MKQTYITHQSIQLYWSVKQYFYTLHHLDLLNQNTALLHITLLNFIENKLSLVTHNTV
jgi:hypothetical protein